MASEGTREAYLFCTAGNHRAHRFYVKTGWHDAGVEATRVPTSTGDFLTVPCHRFDKEIG